VQIDEETCLLEVIDPARGTFPEPRWAAYKSRDLFDMWIKEVQGLIIMYDIKTRESFEAIQREWTNIIALLDGKQPVAVLCGTHCDCVDARQVSTAEGQELAHKWLIPFFESSSLSRINIEETIYSCVREIKKPLSGGSPKNPRAIPKYSIPSIDPWNHYTMASQFLHLIQFRHLFEGEIIIETHQFNKFKLLKGLLAKHSVPKELTNRIIEDASKLKLFNGYASIRCYRCLLTARHPGLNGFIKNNKLILNTDTDRGALGAVLGWIYTGEIRPNGEYMGLMTNHCMNILKELDLYSIYQQESPNARAISTQTPNRLSYISLFGNQEFSDFKFIYKKSDSQQVVFAHKVILQRRTNFFEKLITPSMSELDLPTKEPFESYQEILKFLYTQELNLQKVPLSTLSSLWEVANNWDLECPKIMIETEISNQVDYDTVIEIWSWMGDRPFRTLRPFMKHWLSYRESVRKTSAWKKLPGPLQQEIEAFQIGGTWKDEKPKDGEKEKCIIA